MNDANIAALTEQFNTVLKDIKTEDIYTDPVLGRHCQAALESDIVVGNIGDETPLYVTSGELLFFWLSVLVTLSKKAGVRAVMEAEPADSFVGGGIAGLQINAITPYTLGRKDMRVSSSAPWNKLRKHDLVLIMRPVIGEGLLLELRAITERRGDKIRTSHESTWAHTEKDMQRPVDVDYLHSRLTRTIY